MPPKKRTPQKENFGQRYSRLLPRSTNPILIILKGHLLVEEQIRAIIADHVRDIKFLDGAGLSFWQKLRLFQAIEPSFDGSDRLWSALEGLNKLRNSMAHHAEIEDLETDIDRFLAQYAGEKPEKLVSRKERALKLKSVLTDISIELAAIRVYRWQRANPDLTVEQVPDDIFCL